MQRPLASHPVLILVACAVAAALAAIALVSVTDDDDIDATSVTTVAPATTTSTTAAPAVVASLPAPPPPTTTTTTTTAAPPPPSAPAPAPARPRGGTTAGPATEGSPAAVSGVRCIVRLHGKGGGAGGTGQLGADLFEVQPGGNSAAWGGRQWLYFPESGYGEARAIVQRAIDDAGCGPVVVYGFSNGGAFAAKLYCRGETFGGRVRGVIVDDPVVDHAVAGCRPPAGVRVALYWTGALEAQAQPGWDCASGDWTCEGGTTIGIDAYQGALGVSRKQSPHTSHAPYSDPPELHAWW